MKLFSWCNEPLISHSLLTLEFFLIGCSELIDLIWRKLCMLTNKSLDMIIIRGVIKLALVLHDVGKAHPYYQSTVREKCLYDGICSRIERCPDGNPPVRFSGHQVLSAWFLYRVLEEGVEGYYLETIGSIAILSVLFHHEAIRPDIFNLLRNPYSRQSPFRNPNFHQSIDCKGCQEFMKYLTRCDRDIAEVVISCPSKWEDIGTICEELINVNKRFCRPVTRLYCLLAGPLGGCDTIAASILRPTTYKGGGLPIHIREFAKHVLRLDKVEKIEDIKALKGPLFRKYRKLKSQY